MDFSLTDEQRQLQETVSRFVRKEYPFDLRRRVLESDDGCSSDVWRSFADMGLLAIGLPEAHGGLGGDATDTMIVMEEFGRGLLVEPYLPTVVMCAPLIADAGSVTQLETLLASVVAGEMRLALAHEEPGSRYDFDRVATSARRIGSSIQLNGSKAVVLHAAAAHRLIVSAREAGESRDESGVSLFLVATDAPGVGIDSYRTHDGMRAADIALADVAVTDDDRIGPAGGGMPLVHRAVERAVAALCAEGVGAMSALLEITAAYVKTRKQFGVPIGSFQALQHRMADMLMRAEQARSMAILAATAVDSHDATARARAISAAKVLVGRAARFVGQQAVQLHGGIGVTDEVNVSHYFKRLTAIELTFGDSDHHLERYSSSLAADA